MSLENDIYSINNLIECVESVEIVKIVSSTHYIIKKDELSYELTRNKHSFQLCCLHFYTSQVEYFPKVVRAIKCINDYYPLFFLFLTKKDSMENCFSVNLSVEFDLPQSEYEMAVELENLFSTIERIAFVFGEYVGQSVIGEVFDEDFNPLEGYFVDKNINCRSCYVNDVYSILYNFENIKINSIQSMHVISDDKIEKIKDIDEILSFNLRNALVCERKRVSEAILRIRLNIGYIIIFLESQAEKYLTCQNCIYLYKVTATYTGTNGGAFYKNIKGYTFSTYIDIRSVHENKNDSSVLKNKLTLNDLTNIQCGMFDYEECLNRMKYYLETADSNCNSKNYYAALRDYYMIFNLFRTNKSYLKDKDMNFYHYSCSQIGRIYKNLGQYERALYYLRIPENLNDKYYKDIIECLYIMNDPNVVFEIDKYEKLILELEKTNMRDDLDESLDFIKRVRVMVEMRFCNWEKVSILLKKLLYDERNQDFAYYVLENMAKLKEDIAKDAYVWLYLMRDKY